MQLKQVPLKAVVEVVEEQAEKFMDLSQNKQLIPSVDLEIALMLVSTTLSALFASLLTVWQKDNEAWVTEIRVASPVTTSPYQKRKVQQWRTWADDYRALADDYNEWPGVRDAIRDLADAYSGVAKAVEVEIAAQARKAKQDRQKAAAKVKEQITTFVGSGVRGARQAVARLVNS